MILRWRNPTQLSPLSKVLYCVYEAKQIAQMSPYVGTRDTVLHVIEPWESPQGFALREVRPEGLEFLKKQFETFGPRTFGSAEMQPVTDCFSPRMLEFH